MIETIILRRGKELLKQKEGPPNTREKSANILRVGEKGFSYRKGSKPSQKEPGMRLCDPEARVDPGRI